MASGSQSGVIVGSGNKRMGLVLLWDVPAPARGATSVKVTGSVIVQAPNYGFNDASNSFSWSGSLMGTGSANNKSINVPSSGSQTIHTFSVSVPLTTSTQGATVAFALSGIDYVGVAATVSATIPIPAGLLEPGKPGAPTVTIRGAGVLRASVGTAPAAGAAAIDAYGWQTQRGQTRTTPSNVVDFEGLTAGANYQVSVRAHNAHGWGEWSDWSKTLNMWTVPAKAAKPSLSGATSASLRASLGSVPGNGGGPITGYRWELDRDGVTGTTTGLSWTPTGLAPNTSYRARVQAVNDVGAGPWSDWSAGLSTLPNKPAATGKPAITRQSDTSHKIDWPRNATSAAPYEKQAVKRRMGTPTESGTNWGGWVTIAPSLSATATSYTDTTTIANREYQWQVEAINASGSATSASSDFIRTTPAAPFGLVAEKSGGSITVTGKHERCSTQTYAWQDNPGGAGYVAAGATTSTVEQTFAGVNAAVTHAYRAQARVPWSSAAGAALLTSAWSQPTATVALQAPPGAPAILGPSGVIDRDAALVFAWKHAPVDATKQSAYWLKWRLNGGGYTTLTGTTAQTRTIDALGVSGLLEFEIWTRGDHPTAGPAAVGTATLAAVPTVTLSTPHEGWPSGQAVAHWEFYCADGAAQVQWEAELLDADGARLGSLKTGMGQGNVVPFVDAAQVLKQSTTYTARARARASSGLWSAWAEVTFATDFPLPWEASTLIEWDRSDGSAGLAFPIDDTAAGRIEAVALDVQRYAAGEWVTVIRGLDPYATWTDRTHPIYGDVAWRAVTYSADGAVAEGPPSWLYFRGSGDQRAADEDGTVVWIADGYLSAGDGWTDTIRAYLGLAVDERDFGIDDVALVRFAGDRWPIEFSGAGWSQGLDVDFVTPPVGAAVDAEGVPISTREDVRRVLTARGPKLWRDPDGHCFEVSVGKAPFARVAPGYHGVSLTLTRVAKVEVTA